MLMRFWDPSEGSIHLSGEDLKEYRLEELRSKMALVAQDTYLFNSSLKENILIAKPDASHSEIVKAIEGAVLVKEPGHKINLDDFERPQRAMHAIGG